MFVKVLTIVALLSVSILARADNPVPNDHSTVHILFVVPYEMPDMGGMGGPDGIIEGGAQAKAVPRAVVGDMVLPIDSIHPISISIDGEFVGHSLTGTSGIKPVFVLPSGQHKFEFTCDIFKTTKADLKVVGTGSKQYLIVKLLPETTKDKVPQPSEKAPKTVTPPKG
jgi:hypothetical protein